MPDSFFTKRTFALMAELRANNSKAWFDEHRTAYKQEGQAPFAKMLEAVSFAMQVHDIALTGGAKTMFRAHRDVRFSKDKTPYNSHISGMLTPDGIKNEGRGVLYFRIDPGGGRMGCGHYGLDAKTLAPMRDKMVANPSGFARVLAKIEDGGFRLSMQNTLTNMPRGFKEHSEHEFADYIKLKSLFVNVDIPKASWINGDIIEPAVSLAQACGPLLAWKG